MLNTSLKYVTLKEEYYDYAKDKTKKVVTDRCFIFSVSGAKTEEEHLQAINSFEKVMIENDITCNGYGFGSWKENMNRADSSSYLYLDISLRDMDDKKVIRELYKEWKNEYMAGLKKGEDK